MKKVFSISGLPKLLVLAAIFCASVTCAQPVLPQRSISVAATQSMHFGSFCLTGTGGGTIVLGFDGSRSSTGAIYLSALAPNAQPAIFDIKLCQGRNVAITYTPTTTLTGSNGGTFTLDLGPTERGVSGTWFPVNTDCSFITTVRVGGTLHVPGNSPAGIYDGYFSLTFAQE